MEEGAFMAVVVAVSMNLILVEGVDSVVVVVVSAAAEGVNSIEIQVFFAGLHIPKAN